MKHMTRQEFVASLRRFFIISYSLCFQNFSSIERKIILTNYNIYIFVLLYLPISLITFSQCRKSSGFSRGASIYRGVTRSVLIICKFCAKINCTIFYFSHRKVHVLRHHQHGRWQARIGRVAGNKDLYLGTFSKYIYLIS